MSKFAKALIAVSVLAWIPSAAMAATKDTAMAKKEAACKAQAKAKYSAVHFLKRRAYVKTCLGKAA